MYWYRQIKWDYKRIYLQLETMATHGDGAVTPVGKCINADKYCLTELTLQRNLYFI
jgi:hypothetical protein